MFDEQTLLMIVLGLVLYCLCLKPKKTEQDSTGQTLVDNERKEEQKKITEKFSNYRGDNPTISSQPSPTFTKDLSEYQAEEEPYEVVIPEENNDQAHVDRKHDTTVGDVFDTDLLPDGTDPDHIPFRTNAAQPIAELLPNVDKADWINSGEAIELDDNDVLEVPVRELFNIDTVSGSLRNPSLDLRGSLSNPRIEGISPWMQSSIQADDNIVALTGPREGLFTDEHSKLVINNSPMYTGKDFKNNESYIETA